MQVYEKERQLHRDVAATVEDRLPGVEVLAVELAGPERLVVYVDHPDGVDHALCGRVTDVLRDYLNHYTLDVSSGVRAPAAHAAAFRRRGRAESCDPDHPRGPGASASAARWSAATAR